VSGCRKCNTDSNSLRIYTRVTVTAMLVCETGFVWFLMVMVYRLIDTMRRFVQELYSDYGRWFDGISQEQIRFYGIFRVKIRSSTIA
jgi:hypothetical protein